MDEHDHAPVFSEDLRHPEHNDSTPFAWDELYHAMGEGEEVVGKSRQQSLAYALCQVLDHVLGDYSNPHKVGLRAVALAWVVKPSMVGESLRKAVGLSNEHSVSILTELRRRFGVTNDEQFAVLPGGCLPVAT